MKNSIIITSTVLTALSLITLGFSIGNSTETDQLETSGCKLVASNNQIAEEGSEKVYPDFFYDVGTRFRAVKKGDIIKAKSIMDFIPENMNKPRGSFNSVDVIILDDFRQTNSYERGTSFMLTAAQSKLLKSVDYSANILIKAGYQVNDQEVDYYYTPHLTIVPEKQALYVKGKDILIEYLKENSRESTVIVQKDKLQPGKLYFTVTKRGTISNVELAATSGYSSIDKTMIELLSNLPGKWEPAENSKREKVDQKLVFSFGIIGC